MKALAKEREACRAEFRLSSAALVVCRVRRSVLLFLDRNSSCRLVAR
jgi:hypothetical protein